MTPPGQTVRLPPRVRSIVTVVVTAVAVLVVGTGCFTVNAEIPGTLRGDVASDETERVGVLAIEKNHWFYVFGLVGEPHHLLDEELPGAEVVPAAVVQVPGDDQEVRLLVEHHRHEVDEGQPRAASDFVRVVLANPPEPAEGAVKVDVCGVNDQHCEPP